jgi:hypothetical protein
MPRAGVSIPYESTAQLAFRSIPEQTGINTRILSTIDILGNNIVFIFNELKLVLEIKFKMLNIYFP